MEDSNNALVLGDSKQEEDSDEEGEIVEIEDVFTRLNQTKTSLESALKQVNAYNHVQDQMAELGKWLQVLEATFQQQEEDARTVLRVLRNGTILSEHLPPTEKPKAVEDKKPIEPSSPILNQSEQRIGFQNPSEPDFSALHKVMSPQHNVCVMEKVIHEPHYEEKIKSKWDPSKVNEKDLQSIRKVQHAVREWRNLKHSHPFYCAGCI
jgi:hypothetical protein